MGFLDKLIQGATGGLVGATGVIEPEAPAPSDPITPPTPPAPWTPDGYVNPGVDRIYDPDKYVSPWDISQYKTKEDVSARQDWLNYGQAVTSNRKVVLENLLKENGYVLKGNEWGKYEGGGDGGTVVYGTDGVPIGSTGGGTAKFIPLSSPVVEEWKTINRAVNLFNEDTANWSEADDEMIRRLLGGTGSSGSGGSGGSGGGSGSSGKVKTPLDYEMDKADEVSRQRSEAEKYTDQYLDTIAKTNDISLQEASRAKASNAMWSDAYDKATEADVLRKAGKLDWDQGAVAPTFSDPLHYIKLAQADPNLIKMWEDAVPEYVLPTYNLNQVVGLPGQEGFTDEDFPWLPRLAGGTTTPIWDQIRNGTLRPAQGGGYESTQGSNTVTPVASNLPPQAQPYADYNPSDQYGPGRVPINSVLPASERIADQSTWVNNVVDGMIGNILSGKGGYPPGYDGPRWDDYTDDQGRTIVDPNFKVGLTQWVANNTNNPGLTSIWGAPPSTKAIYIDDPSKPPASSTTIKATQVPSSGGSTSGGTIYTGVYGGQGSAAANDRSDPDLDKKMAWEREKFNWEKERDLVAEELARKGDLRADEVLALQKRQQEIDERIQQADLVLRQIASELESSKFEYTKEWNDKQAAFEKEKFEYQKTKDDRADQLQRAAITSEMLANPNDQYRLGFFYQGQADPTGTAYDAFTGENRGQKTYGQARSEDAELFKASQKAPRLPTGGFTRSILSILGDDPDVTVNKATGHEEMVFNPTGAPFAVLKNEDAKMTGLVPPKGKPFGKHVKLGA